MTSGKYLDEQTKRRIRKLRARRTSTGQPLSHKTIGQLLQLSRQTVAEVLEEARQPETAQR